MLTSVPRVMMAREKKSIIIYSQVIYGESKLSQMSIASF